MWIKPRFAGHLISVRIKTPQCLWVDGKGTKGKSRWSNPNRCHSSINRESGHSISSESVAHTPLQREEHVISKCLKPGISVCDLSNTKTWNVIINCVLIFSVKIILKKTKKQKKTTNWKLLFGVAPLAYIIIFIAGWLA